MPPPATPPPAAPPHAYEYLFADRAVAPPPPVPPVPPPVPPQPGPPPGRGRGLLVGVVAGVVLLAATVVGGVLLLGGGDDDTARPEAAQATTAGEADETTEPEETAEPTGEPSAEPSGPSRGPLTSGAPQPEGQVTARVRRLPAGLACADLAGRGLPFVQAVGYWQLHGRPIAMDGDANGIPCQTVYPDDAVRAVYGSLVDTAVPDVTLLPAGLDCAYFRRFAIDYPYAVAYWREEPKPGLMDPDGNGRPCEDAYPRREVAEFWR